MTLRPPDDLSEEGREEVGLEDDGRELLEDDGRELLEDDGRELLEDDGRELLGFPEGRPLGGRELFDERSIANPSLSTILKLNF
ncbi:unannotated protein [freshwater metagenome]|uniref:Unannotated protein n=1 Tax=freshwater metagenome TaxID=449393 RepID=A0A6J7TQF3_9ZZZZ